MMLKQNLTTVLLLTGYYVFTYLLRSSNDAQVDIFESRSIVGLLDF